MTLSILLTQGRPICRLSKSISSYHDEYSCLLLRRKLSHKHTVQSGPHLTLLPDHFLKLGYLQLVIVEQDLQNILLGQGMVILTAARDWVLVPDVNGKLKFPSEVATTRLRPDLIIYSTSTKRIVVGVNVSL